MYKEVFDRIYSRIEYFYDIHMNSYHTEIANLAYEEYAGLFLEIISKDGFDLLKDQVSYIENRELLIKILIFSTVVDLEWAKSTYKQLIDDHPFVGSNTRPTIWNNFVDNNYLQSIKEFLTRIDKKRNLGLNETLFKTT